MNWNSELNSLAFLFLKVIFSWNWTKTVRNPRSSDAESAFQWLIYLSNIYGHVKGFETQTPGCTIQKKKKWYMTDVSPSTVHLSIILASRNTDCASLLKFLNLFILTSSSLNKAYGFPRQMVKPIKHTKLFIYHKWHYPLKKSDLKKCHWYHLLLYRHFRRSLRSVELLPATHTASSVRYI